MNTPTTTTASIVLDRKLSLVAKDYIALLKPRVMMLVIFTALATLFSSKEMLIHRPISRSLLAILLIAVGAGAAGALNMWYEAEVDGLMTRTRLRPLPSERISSPGALTYALFLSCFSVWYMGYYFNLLSAALLLGTIVFYAVVYTIFLKPNTVQNIVIGGISGSMPPIVASAAVLNTITIESFFMFLIIFFWTPPHFWSLSLFRAEDYKRANIPMLPNVYGVERTKNEIFIYTIFLSFVCILPYFLGIFGLIYFLGAVFLNGMFMYGAYQLKYDKIMPQKLFWSSIKYLFFVFLLIIIDRLWSFV